MNRLVFIIIVLGIFSCVKSDDVGSSNNNNGVPCDQDHTERVGAKCNDGTSSSATGQGACSSHDGVDYWLCK